ncbi:MAG: hypothetical protein IPN69_00030 [Acidobacteria bacterium]|nr:hypothetical protein [Acidobacteriota bacterium]
MPSAKAAESFEIYAAQASVGGAVYSDDAGDRVSAYSDAPTLFARDDERSTSSI